MRPCALVLAASLHALPALCQDAPLAVGPGLSTAGDHFVGVSAGYSWYSPRGSHWGVVTGRRIYLADVRLEWVHGSAGPLAIASTVELPLGIVQRTKQESSDCWRPAKPNVLYCVHDYSSRVAVGAGALPGLKLYVNRRGDPRVFAAGAAGFMMFNNEVPVRRAGRFNFALEYGVGVDLPTGRDRTMTLGYKFYHISNGYTWDYNPGLDANILYIGWLRRH